MKEYSLKRTHLREMVETPDLQLRPGTDALFRSAHEKEVQFHIFSAGLYDVIHAYLDYTGMAKYGMHVVSNMMVFDEEERIVGFKGALIHTLNKNSTALRDSPDWELVKVRNSCSGHALIRKPRRRSSGMRSALKPPGAGSAPRALAR